MGHHEFQKDCIYNKSNVPKKINLGSKDSVSHSLISCKVPGGHRRAHREHQEEKRQEFIGNFWGWRFKKKEEESQPISAFLGLFWSLPHG